MLLKRSILMYSFVDKEEKEIFILHFLDPFSQQNHSFSHNEKKKFILFSLFIFFFVCTFEDFRICDDGVELKLLSQIHSFTQIILFILSYKSGIDTIVFWNESDLG